MVESLWFLRLNKGTINLDAFPYLTGTDMLEAKMKRFLRKHKKVFAMIICIIIVIVMVFGTMAGFMQGF